MLNQIEQDNIWKYYQNQARQSFDSSYPRLRYLAESCCPGERVLNIGVGSGYLEKILVDLGVEIYSLDPCLETIGRLSAELNLGSRAQQGYSHNLPFEAGYFDKVIMTEVLEHLSGDVIHLTLEEIKRVLKPGGKFTGTVPFRENLQDNEVVCPRCQAQFHRWGHISSFDAESMGMLLRKHGFRVDRLYPRSFPDFRRPGLKLFIKALFRYVLGRMGEPLVGPNLYFVVRPE